MRIAFVSTILRYPFGGADWLWTESAGAAIAAGHKIFIGVSPLVVGAAQIRQLTGQGALLHVRRSHTAFRGRLTQWKLALGRRLHASWSLLGALASFKPDLLILCQGGTYDFLVEDGLAEWLQVTGTRYVVICQSNADSDTPTSRLVPVARRFAANATRLVFVSTHNRRLAESQLGTSITNAVCVQNPVRIARKQPLAWPQGNGMRLAAVCRLEPDKGVDMLLHALVAALGHVQGWTLDVYGRGPLEFELRAQVAHYGLEQHVRFAGFVPDIESIWRDHHLLVLPSRREGCPLAMLEALACGRPVLATPVGGVDDWICDGISGFVCRDHSIAGLMAALSRAWQERANWRTMGLAAFGTTQSFDPHPGRTLLTVAGVQLPSTPSTQTGHPDVVVSR